MPISQRPVVQLGCIGGEGGKVLCEGEKEDEGKEEGEGSFIGRR